ECGIAGDKYEFRECLSGMLEATEAAKTEITMGASIFQKVMIPLMNILTYLFYGLAPIVIAVAVATGIQGVGIILKYAFFGFWVQSWMPAAVFINYVMIQQLRNDLSNFKLGWDRGALNITHFYDVVSTKLMVASDILAATPMITLAILGGGVYAFTSIAGSMGRAAASKSNSGANAPRIRDVQPLHTFAGFHHSNAGRNLGNKGAGNRFMGAGVGDADAALRGVTGTTTVNTTTSNAVAAAKGRTSTVGKKLTASRNRLGQFTTSALNTVGSTLTGQSQTSTQGAYSDAVNSRLAKSLGVDTKTDRETQNHIMATVAGHLTAALALGKGGGAQGRKAAENFLAKKLGWLSADLGGSLAAQDAAKLARRLVEGASTSDNINLDRLKEGRLTESDVGSLIHQATE
ncbi:MAG TPA: hypothetical protein EYP34_10580, partial [Chromatiaceae bacterium]|nr:hypothetical protein [Chromatiaceae bacterium]